MWTHHCIHKNESHIQRMIHKLRKELLFGSDCCLRMQIFTEGLVQYKPNMQNDFHGSESVMLWGNSPSSNFLSWYQLRSYPVCSGARMSSERTQVSISSPTMYQSEPYSLAVLVLVGSRRETSERSELGRNPRKAIQSENRPSPSLTC
jgi:hypothetical protein